MRREGDTRRDGELARCGREGRRRDGRGHTEVGAAPRRDEPRGVRVGEDVRLRLGRLRRERRVRERDGGASHGRAEAPPLRDHRRPRLVGRAAVRRRDRRLRRAGRMTLLHRLHDLREAGGRGVLFTVVEGDGVGGKALVVEGGETVGDGVPEEALAQFDELVRRGRNGLLELADGVRVFAEWYGPPPRLLVYGAVDTAEALCRGAKLLGWTAIVADARAAFITAERMPSADMLIQKWPQDAIAEVAPDHQTAIVVLTHDDKFDEPALLAALRTEAFYIGALGSRRNQERRRERLLEAGASEKDLARISGPSGLDIGADSQAETALSILAEALAVRAGRGGGPLRDARQRIHAEVP